MEDESLKQLKAKYNHLLDQLKKYDDIYSELSRQSREADRGSFGFLDDNPDLKHGWYLNQALEKALFSLSLVIRGKQDDNGECSKKCIGCFGGQYDHETKGWSCQVICECK